MFAGLLDMIRGWFGGGASRGVARADSAELSALGESLGEDLVWFADRVLGPLDEVLENAEDEVSAFVIVSGIGSITKDFEDYFEFSIVVRLPEGKRFGKWFGWLLSKEEVRIPGVRLPEADVRVLADYVERRLLSTEGLSLVDDSVKVVVTGARD